MRVIFNMADQIATETGDLVIDVEDQNVCLYPENSDESRDWANEPSVVFHLGDGHVIEIIGYDDDPREVAAIMVKPDPDLMDENGEISLN